MKNLLSDEELQKTVEAYKNTGSQRKAAKLLGIAVSSMHQRLTRAAEKGLLGTKPVLPGFRIAQITTDKDGAAISIQQKPERGDVFEVPAGHSIKGISAFVDASSGREIAKWVKTKKEFPTEELIRTVVDELKKEIVPAKPVQPPKQYAPLLLNQYICTDHHFGMLVWGEEVSGLSYDIKIAEEVILDWFRSAIALSPDAHTAVFAQLGDYMHHDSLEAVTPTNRNILEVDSRLQKIIRVVIRVTRQIIAMLLQKHRHVRVIMASANHDPASSAWMRELLQALYENEPRISIDTSPDIYYCYEWGNTALFYHHGHKRNVNNVDSTFAGKFKEVYGRSNRAYAHIGHMHNDAVVDSNLMRVERHRTLAPPDAYANHLGFVSAQDAKVITYHKKYGEISRLTLSPALVGEKKISKLFGSNT